MFSANVISFAVTDVNVITKASREVVPFSIEWEVTADALHVRSGAGLSYPIVDTLYKGDRIWGSITKKDNGYTWLQIGDNRRVAMQYLLELS